MKKLSVALIAVVLCLCMVFAVACDNTPKDTSVKIDMINGWAGNPDEESYEATVKDNVLTLKFEKHDTWEWAKKSFATETEANLGKVKTLVMKAKMESNVTPLSATLKFYFTGEGNDPQEVHIGLTGEFRTYEWDISKLPTDKISHILLFAQGGKIGSGSITISEMYLTSEAMNAENSVEKYPVVSDNPPATEHEVNTITAENKAVNAGWYNIGGSKYTITKDGSKYAVSFEKNGEQWGAMGAFVTGAAINTMKSFKFVLKGAEGTKLMLKPLDSNTVEPTVTLTGGEDEFKIDIAALAATVDGSAELKVVIIAAPGNDAATGSFEILSAEFSTEEVQAPAPTEYVNEITAENKSINGGWIDGGDGDYTITAAEGGGWKIDFAKTGEWHFFKANISGAEELMLSFKSIKFVLDGTEGTVIKFKPFDNGALETDVTLAGGEQTVAIPLNGVTAGDLAKALIVFAAPGNASATGSFVIKSAELSTDAVSNGLPAFDNDLSALEPYQGPYTLNWADGVLTISHTQEVAQYSNCNARYNWTEDQTVKLTIKNIGEAAAVVKVGVQEVVTYSNVLKAASIDGVALEASAFTWGVMTTVEPGAETVIVITVDLARKPCAFFVALNGEGAAGTNATAGSITVKAEAAEAPAPAEKTNEIKGTAVGVNAGWYDMGDKCYTITEANGVYTVQYTSVGEWSCIKALVGGEDISKVKAFIITVKGTEGTELLLKPFNKGGEYEKKVTLTGGNDTFYINLTGAEFDYTQPVVIFAEPGVAGGSGEFQILGARFSYGPVNVVSAEGKLAGWYDNGDHVFTIVESEAGAAVTKIATQYEWAALKINITGAEIANAKKIQFVINGAAGKMIKIQPFNNGNTGAGIAQEVELTGEDQTLTCDISTLTAELNCKDVLELVVYFNWAKASEEGTFTIKSVTFLAE